MKFTISLILCSLISIVFGIAQELQLNSKIFLDIDQNSKTEYLQILKLKSNTLLLIGHQRKNKKLYTRLTEITEVGKVLKDTLIGDLESYTRPTNALIHEDHLWLGLSINGTESKVLKMTHKLDITEEYDLSRKAGILRKINIEENTIQLLYNENANRYEKYPVLVQYFIETEETIETRFDKKNSVINMHMDSIPSKGVVTAIHDLPEDQRNGYIELEMQTNRELNKITNSFIRYKGGFAVGGSENTDNFADYWYAKSNGDGTIDWEVLKELDDDVGVDVISHILTNQNGNLYFIGQHYSKPDNFNYDIRIIVANGSETEIADLFYDFEGGEIPTDAIAVDNQILIAGHTSPHIKKTQTPLYLLLDQNGKEISHLIEKGITWQVPISLTTYSDSFMILGKHEEDDTERFLSKN